MRKLLALTLTSYLLALSFPFVVFADDYESCYEMGECDGVSEEDKQKISEQIAAEEAAEETSDTTTETDTTETETDPNAQQEGESDCDYNGTKYPSIS